ncbi:MAG TPA: RtcB family protein [Anaerolineaceae bacterium]|nr:RtcB family protein [Anaerolineales bacterium]HIQ08854.1 RtcB family protein [Anaerolineaceae bacterium]
MIRKQDLRRLDDYLWEIPVSYHRDMQVPVRLFLSECLLEHALQDASLQQAINVARSLPGLVGFVAVMPDMHQGYGFPIGGVAATRWPNGAISPGGVGYDIGCGVRLLASGLTYAEAEEFLDELADALNVRIPSGVGRGGSIKVKNRDLEQVCHRGVRWALDNGYAWPEDLAHIENQGSLEGADFGKVSKRAKERGRPQLGTLGAGNHFVEVGLVDQVFDTEAAQALGLFEGQITLLVHTGSRGFGHQVCSDYVRELQSRPYVRALPDRDLAYAPLDTALGRDYLAAMRCAANYAFTNRQLITYHARAAFEQVFRGIYDQEKWALRVVYDLHHNTAKIETHKVNGKKVKVCVHRKGATRAFGPGHPELPPEYRPIGQPVLVPGSMGTASWVLVGTEDSMRLAFGSTCHGAGRVMSRAKAKKSVRGDDLRRRLEAEGIHVRAGSLRGLAEEAPHAYKDVDLVVESVVGAGIARKVARLVPVAVIKG